MSSIAEFYELEAEKIIADGKKIALFTKHPGTLGAFREARLQQYLSEHVGGALTVSSGFIAQHDPEGDEIYDVLSRQIDGLIYESGSAPLLKAKDFVVVEPASVAAVIEVKSNLTLSKLRRIPADAKTTFSDTKGNYIWDGTLVTALINVLQSVRTLHASGVPRGSFFAGIISYSASSIDQFTTAMTSGELPKQLDVSDIDDLPDEICVFQGKWFGFSAYKWTEAPHYDFSDESDPTCSFLLESDGQPLGGSLQLFTANLTHVLFVARGGQSHKVGGLRSGKGFRGTVESHKLSIASPRQHDV